MRNTFVSVVVTFLLAGASYASENALETSTVDVAKRNGVTQCLGQIKKISEHVLGTKAHDTHGLTKQDSPDEHMFLSVNVKDYSDGDSHVLISSTPTKNGCDGFYVETSVMMMSCDKVQVEVFKDWSLSRELNGGTKLLTNPSGSIHVYLSSQKGALCLVSKQETLYN